MVGGWLSRPDYMAKRMLAMLDELGEVLHMSSTDFVTNDRKIAQEIYERWNRPMIEYTQRDAMFHELGFALNRLSRVPVSYAISSQALAVPWAKNLYESTTNSAIEVPLDDEMVPELKKQGAVTTPEDLAFSDAKHLRIAGMTMDLKPANCCSGTWMPRRSSSSNASIPLIGKIHFPPWHCAGW